MQTVRQWLEQLGLPQYAEVFERSPTDLELLCKLTDEDLVKGGIHPLGHRQKLLKAIAELNASRAPSPARHPREPVSAHAERRQLTVMFCDFVGSTALAERLDPEELRDLIQAYQRACGEVIARYEGHVAQYLDDGMMVYFGWPSAHEDDAQRAVRAALAMVQAVARLSVPSGPLAARMGIHTGVVVVGKVGVGAAHEQLALGDTPNLASRLKSFAPRGGVVLSDRTRQLVGGSFDYRDLGLHAVKGISEPVHAWQAVSLRTGDRRFDGERGGQLNPMLGRELEFAMLLHAWRRARSGRGQVVLLCGEPGIGKSRILRALREKLGEKHVPSWQYQCSSYYANSTLYPVIEHLERALKFEREDAADVRLNKLHALLASYGRPELDANLIGRLLSLPAEARYGALGMTPRKQKDETIRALNDVIEVCARKQPVLMLVEDLHWADPTTLESLEALLGRLGHLALLLVATYRPEFRPQWIGQPAVSALTLSRLDAEQTRAIAARVTRGKDLPQEIMDQIVAKTDGIPLFVEELTKAILESGLLRAEGTRYELAGPLHALAIPHTLRDSLMARLDRLKPVKDVAQIGACIGREFQAELLAVVSPLPAAELALALNQLVASELVFKRGQPPSVRYSFKHALIQEAAYDSLLKARRIQIHAQIAQALEEHFPETKNAEPELLAHHLSEAGLMEKAIYYWHRAGELALQRVALKEAIAHLSKGLELTATLPASSERDSKELTLRTRLGTAWMALRGWAAPEVEVNFSPALRLAKSLDHRPSYLPVLHGLYVYDFVRGRIAESLRWVREMQDTAEALDDPELRIAGHRLALPSHFYLGHLEEASHHSDRIAALYDADLGRHIESLTNVDPLVARGMFGAPCLWMLGYPDRALQLLEATQAHARAHSHPFGLCFILTRGSWVFDLRGEPDELLTRAEEGEHLGRIHSMPLFSEVLAPLCKATACVHAGRTREGVLQLTDALGKWSALGACIATPYYKAVLAEGIAQTGEVETGLGLIEESLTQIERPGWEERVHLAEVLRLKGWMLMRQGRGEEAEPQLRASIDWARQQQAKSWELRSSTTLAELLIERGQRDAARELLVPIYNWFTEGFDTHDLKAACQLLESLR